MELKDEVDIEGVKDETDDEEFDAVRDVELEEVGETGEIGEEGEEGTFEVDVVGIEAFSCDFFPSEVARSAVVS